MFPGGKKTFILLSCYISFKSNILYYETVTWADRRVREREMASSHSRPGPSLTRGPVMSLSGDSVESLCEFALENALSLGSVSAMSERASLSSSSGWVKIQSSARSRLLF